MTRDEIALVFFGKSPVPGKVKTRLARTLGASAAAALAEAFLRDGGRRYAGVPGCSPVLAADDPSDPFWRSAFPPPWRIEAQGEGDLGDRLARAFSREHRRFEKVAALGSDHPALPADGLSRLLAAANGVWPTRDGGYAAIVLSRSHASSRLFQDVEWSTSRVLAQTLARAAAAEIELARMPETYDVDEEEDLERLAADLAGRDPDAPDFPEHTWKALRALGGAADRGPGTRAPDAAVRP